MRLDIAYRGTGFHGFAANQGVRTVAGELSAALAKILGEAPVLTVAGRTDGGVHATAQVVSFPIGGDGLRRITGSGDGDRHREGRPGSDGGPDRLGRLASSLNGLLQPEIAVTAASVAEDGFDARHSAMSRAYEYRVRSADHPDPRFADVEWHVREPLDVDAMNAAARRFVGEHDFASFCRRPKNRPDASLVRTVTRAHWSAEGALLLFGVEANAFCHQMVRAIVGHCVSVGRGDRSASDVPAVLAARDRQAAAPIAPPHGLTLVAVGYPEKAYRVSARGQTGGGG